MYILMMLLIASAFLLSAFAITITISEAMPRIIEIMEQRSLPAAREPRRVIVENLMRHEEQSEAAVLKTDHFRSSKHAPVTIKRPMMKRKMQINSKPNDKAKQDLADNARRPRVNRA
jgi:hypothetical protein